MKLDPEVWGKIFPELVGPDETQLRPILGFRINRVEFGRGWWGKPSVALRSIGPTAYSWEAGQNEAACWVSRRLVADQSRHVAPGTGCSCGLYAAHDVEQLRRLMSHDSDRFVLAGVAGTGIVRVHTYGWRAQFARIVAFSVQLPEIPTDRTLSPREKLVLQLLFGSINGHKLTLDEVGKRFGVSAERIRQIATNALRKTRHPSRSKEAQGRLSAPVAEALEAKYQVPVIPLDKLKEVMAGAGNFWEDMR